MALNETLRTTPPMLLRDYSTLAPADQKTVMTETLPKAREQSRQLQEQEAMQTIEQTKQMETARANELRRQGRVGQQQIEQAFGELREPEPFVAPTRSPEELASTAFGDLIASLMVGGIAKASAISQLESIKGMQDARAKNDQLAVDAAYKNWEMAEKQKETFNKRVLDKLNRIRELMPYEKEAAMAEINLLKPELSGGIAQTKLARGDIDGAIKAVEAQQATINKQKQEMAKLEYQRGTTLMKLRETEAAKAEAKQEKPVKISSTIEKSLRQGNELLSRMEQLKATAKPEFFAIAPSDTLASLRLGAQEVGLTQIANLLGKPVNDEAVLWWKNYNDLISEERKERFGATLTGNEKQSFRETIVAPSSTYDIGMGVLDRKIKLAETGLSRDFKQLSALGAPQVQIDSYLPDVDTQRFTAPKPAAGGATNVDAQRQEALRAIERGADRNAVAQRFKERTGQDL